MRWVLALALALLAAPGLAANVYLARDVHGTISLEGRIVEGDAAKFERFMRAAGPSIETLRLRSPGGRAAEAMKIGALVRQLMLRTEAPRREGDLPVCLDEAARCDCASACVFIWAAGVHRNGDAHLEVHRPAYADGSEEERQSTTQEAIRDYFTLLETPPELIALALATPPDRLAPVPSGTVRSAGGFVPSIDSILAGQCPSPRQAACERRILGQMRRSSHEKLLESAR